MQWASVQKHARRLSSRSVRSGSEGKKKTLQPLVEAEERLTGAHGVLKGVDEPFNETFGCRMVGGTSDLLDAINLQEVLELFTHELRTVVRTRAVLVGHGVRRLSTDTRRFSLRWYSAWGQLRAILSGRLQAEETSIEERSGEVDVHSLPRTSGPFPRMKRCAGRLFLLKMVTVAFADSLLNVLVDSRPPDVTAGKPLQPHDARVTQVQFLDIARNGRQNPYILI